MHLIQDKEVAQRIKNLQRCDPTEKIKWTHYCETRGQKRYDPNVHEAPFLAEFFKVSCVDLLANNAGVNLNFGWRKCMEINIISVMLGTDIALERMRKAGKSGQIINTASMAGFAPGLSEKMTAYTVSKGGLK